jgi:hypothetical protein
MQRALKAFRAAFTATMTDTARQIAGTVVSGAGPDGAISPREGERIIERVGHTLRAVFVDRDGRTVGSDGTPYAPYARLLMAAIAWETREVVAVHAADLQRRLPDDVRAWLLGARRPAKEQTERTARILADARAAKLLADNPLAQYDAAHTWVDPNGYTLSERIWRAEAETRARLNAMLRDEIRRGTGALQLSRKLETFLVPGRAAVRTNRPYGSDASYFSLRLARTEVARAGNAAALAASQMNPYVTGIDVARSSNGDPSCPVCPQHATIGIGGERLREPYPVDAANVGPYHSHCMCAARSVVTQHPDAVVASLRAAMEAPDSPSPVITPVQPNAFTQMLLGAAVASLLPQIADILGLSPTP